MASVQIGILPLRNHLSDLRRGDDFSAAVRSVIHGVGRGRVSVADGFSFPAGLGVGLGVDEGSADVEMNNQPSIRDLLPPAGILVVSVFSLARFFYGWAVALCISVALAFCLSVAWQIYRLKQRR